MNLSINILFLPDKGRVQSVGRDVVLNLTKKPIGAEIFWTGLSLLIIILRYFQDLFIYWQFNLQTYMIVSNLNIR